MTTTRFPRAKRRVALCFWRNSDRLTLRRSGFVNGDADTSASYVHRTSTICTMKVYKADEVPVNYGSWEIVGRGRSADMLAGDEPSDIFRELQDENDDGEPNAIVDGLIDDLRDVGRIGRSAYTGHHNWIDVGNEGIG